MRVICIDGKRSHPDTDYDLPEGVLLQVYQSPAHEEYYRVIGFEKNKSGSFNSWNKRRFIPISSIDETEMERESITKRVLQNEKV